MAPSFIDLAPPVYAASLTVCLVPVIFITTIVRKNMFIVLFFERKVVQAYHNIPGSFMQKLPADYLFIHC